jgi:hypothetical protein
MEFKHINIALSSLLTLAVLLCCGLLGYDTVCTNVSEEHIASGFRVKALCFSNTLVTYLLPRLHGVMTHKTTMNIQYRVIT